MEPVQQGFKNPFLGDDRLSWAERALALSVGVAVPMLGFGIAATQALMALSTVLALYLTFRDKESRPHILAELTNPLTAAVVFMLLVWIVVSVFSQEVMESMKIVGRMAGILLATLLVWAQLAARPQVRELALKLLMISAVLMLAGAVILIVLPKWMAYNLIMGQGYEVQPRMLFKRFASAAMLMAPIILWVGWIYRGRYLGLALGGFGLSIVLIFITLSRSAIAGLLASAFVVCVLMILTSHRFAKWGMLVSAGLLVIGLAAVGWIRSLKADLSAPLTGIYLPEWLLDPHRQLIWKFTLEKYTEHPFTGWGINTINHLPGAEDIIPTIGGAYISSHPHNWIIEVLAETGIIGLLALLLVLLLLARNLIGEYLKFQSLNILVASALCAAYVASNLFNYSVWSSWWQMCFLSLLALVLAHGYRKPPIPDTDKPRAVITVTEDWAFLRHRQPTALALADAGTDVYVVANDNGHSKEIEALGYHFIPWGVDRGSMNPLKEWDALHRLARIYGQIQPAFAYHVALKPILYGTLASALATRAMVVNLFSGLGVLFISQSQKHRGVRAAVMAVLRVLFASPRVCLMVQNSDDQKFLNDAGISDDQKTLMVPGSGIDLDEYPLAPEPEGDPVAVVVSRMLWDKGIGEVIEAARILKEKGVGLKIRLIGAPDPSNPASISEEQLISWHEEGLVEWLGQRDDIAAQLAAAHIALLPSYREGMPRSLLEAAATGRPLVAFDAPGCRDLVRNGENGLLVPLKDVEALVDALKKLALDKDLRQRLGTQARLDVEQTFASDVIRQRLKAFFLSLTKS